MESQKQPAMDKVSKRIARAAEVIIRKCVLPKYRLPGNDYYLHGIELCMAMYREKCYPLGLADERIADYLLYQIYRYREQIEEQKKWTITWLFTAHAVEKYKTQFLSKDGKSGMAYYIQEWMRENDLDMHRILNVLDKPKPNEMVKYIYMPSEEHIKKRWLNQEVGFTMCQLHTTGWSPKSPTCQQCQFTEKCIASTQKQYPELIRVRKESQHA